jgi:hypothetical protein
MGSLFVLPLFDNGIHWKSGIKIFLDAASRVIVRKIAWQLKILFSLERDSSNQRLKYFLHISRDAIESCFEGSEAFPRHFFLLSFSGHDTT